MVNLGRRDPQWAGGARRTTTHGGHTHCGRAREGTVAALPATVLTRNYYRGCSRMPTVGGT